VAVKKIAQGLVSL